MESHVKILGILHVVFGGVGVLGALCLLVLFGGIAGLIGASGKDAHIAVPVLSGFGSFLFFLVLTRSLPGLIAGVGLLQFRPWARILTIILSFLDLVFVPFGTALGIYGLWVLLSQGTERLFQPTGQTYP